MKTVQSNVKHYLSDSLPSLNNFSHVLAASFYLSSTLIIVNTRNATATALARLLLFNSALLIVVGLSCKIVQNWESCNRFKSIVFCIDVLGYFLLGVAALKEEVYN